MNEQPDSERIKIELARAIVGLIDERRLTDGEVSARLGLAPTEIARLRVGNVAGFSIEHLVVVLNALDQQVEVIVEPAPIASEAADRRPIWEKIKGIMADVPPQEWEKVPTDLAQNLDHYLYGTRKTD